MISDEEYEKYLITGILATAAIVLVIWTVSKLWLFFGG